MRGLLLTQVVPFPPDSGPKVKIWNLIKCLAGPHLLVAAEDFAAAVARLLANPGVGAALAREGRSLIERHDDYRIAWRPATDLDDAIAAARRAPARCAPAGAA